MAVIKLNGTALASSQWNDFGTIAAINDGNNATGWSGGGVGVTTDWAAIQFPGAEKVVQADAYFYSWGNTIVIGYANAAPSSKASFTVVRTIDIRTQPNDDLGVPWARLTKNTIILPGDVGATYWGIYTNDVGPGKLGFNGGGLDRARIMELNFYKNDVIVPALPAGPNPKPPAVSPTSPFTGTPAGWTRTEFAVNGSGTFTPAVDTTLIAVALQGAGAGGRVNVSLTGQSTPDDATRNGGDSFISNSAGVIAVAPGGVGFAVTDVPRFAGIIGTPCDWLRAIDNNARAGATTAAGSATATGGGQAYLDSAVAGATFTLAAQDTNGGVTANTVFTGAAALPFTPTFVNAARNSSTGLATNVPYASAGTPTQIASIEFSFKAVPGQVITLNCQWGWTSGTASATYKWNDNPAQFFSNSTGSSSPISYTVTNDGLQTIRLELSSTAQSGTVPYLRATSMTLTNIGQAGASSGSSGRLAAFFFLPETFTYNVGKGGIGQPGGQAITSAQNGTRGSGGSGAGGNGGDGVIIIYEYKSVLPLDKAPLPIFTTYNQAVTTEVLAAYRTNYLGVAATGKWQTQTSYTHKVRPRTKTVLALIVGPGGKQRYGSAVMPNEPGASTVISATSLSNLAEGGFSGSWAGPSTGYGGAGGNMQDGPNVLSIGKGQNGTGTDQSSNNTAQVAGNYGLGSGSGYLTYSGGGNGGFGLVVIPESAFAGDRTISMQVGNTDTSAFPGAVYLFETEEVYGPFISGLVESVLRKDGNAGTAITQTSELILRKENLAATLTSQNVEHIFYKESESSNNLQVTHANIAFIVDADDPTTAISQSTEQVLIKSGPATTLVSQSTEQVLMRVGTLPFRISGSVEMIFAAELPSVFWLNFGTLQYPLVKRKYDSQVGRATSVQPGAYIQLESPHMDGTTLVVNGVEVGLSSPVANNDQVFIRGGITNFFQTEMNVYTYYTKNGVIARELVGQWKFTREPLVPTIGRKYSALYVNNSWIWSARGFGFATITALWTRAKTKLGDILSAVMTSGRSAVADLTAVFTKALSSMFSGNGAVVSQNNHATAQGPQSIITKMHRELGAQIGGAGVSSPHVNLQSWDGYTHTKAGYSTVEMLNFERSHIHMDHYENTDFAGDHQVGYGLSVELEFKPLGPVGYGTTHKDYEYNAVGKSYSSEQKYTAVYNSGSGNPFSMTAIGTIAYSVLASTTYTKNSGIGTGSWLMPVGQADVARTGFGYVAMNPAERAIAHPHLADRSVEKGAEHNQGYFESSPIMHIVGFGQFEQSVVKTSVNSGVVDRAVIHTQHYLATANLTAYRPAEAINGRGKASLYMGFDTLQDVQDYTEQYSGVTTLAAYNGYVYNLAVDKSFVCEIYYNGPISGLIQGG